MQELQCIRGTGVTLWDTSNFLSEDSAVADIAHSFFGHSDSPTLLQIFVYTAYLAIALALLFRPRKSPVPRQSRPQ